MTGNRKAIGRNVMQIEVTVEQLDLLCSLVASRIDELARARRDAQPPASGADQPQRNLESLRLLQTRFLQSREDAQEKQAAAWAGYLEARKIPNNPPPGA
jgi:hypothetical protein